MAYDPAMARFHHVNLGIPEGGLDAQAAFLVDVLGLQRVDPGPDLAGRANWFEADDGTQVHLSVDPDHRPAARAHVAMEFGDEFAGIEQRLGAAGYEAEEFAINGTRVLITKDPAGNRWELRSAGASA